MFDPLPRKPLASTRDQSRNTPTTDSRSTCVVTEVGAINRLVSDFGRTRFPADEHISTVQRTRLALRLAALIRWTHSLRSSSEREEVDSALDSISAGQLHSLVAVPAFGAVLREAESSEYGSFFGGIIRANLVDAADIGTGFRSHVSEVPRFLPLFLSKRTVEMSPAVGSFIITRENCAGSSSVAVIHHPSCSRGSRVPCSCLPILYHDLRSVEFLLYDEYDRFLLETAVPQQRSGIRFTNLRNLTSCIRWMSTTASIAPLRQEVEQWVSVVIPAPAMDVLYGATSPLMTGALALTLNYGPIDIAEILVHEVQHSKLCGLLDHVHVANERLITETDPADLPSPWRPEPRPAEGLLHGCASLVAVAEMWSDLEQASYLDGDCAAVHRWLRSTQVRTALDTLRGSRRLTDLGCLYLDGLEGRVDALTRVVPRREAIQQVLSDDRRQWRLGSYPESWARVLSQ